MKREIKVKVTVESEEPLTEAEISAIKKSLPGQLIKTLTASGDESRVYGIFEHICHVHPVHTPQTMTA